MRTGPEKKNEVIYYDGDGHEAEHEIYWENRLERIIDRETVAENGNRQRTERFFSENGFCHMSILSEHNGKSWQVTNVKLFSEKEKSVSNYRNLDELRQIFFTDYVKSCQEKNIFVFCDPILDFYPGFEKMHDPQKNIYRIAVNHGVGFGGEKEWYSEINPRLRDLIEKSYPPEMEALVLLTEEAAGDLKKRMGNRTIFYHLPNTVYIPDQIEAFESRDLNKIVYIGRLDERQKRITHAIRAFAMAVKKHPDARFDIYGRGDDRELLEQLIRELGLSGKAVIRGFTDRVNEIYQKAAMTVFTSVSEGFSLSQLEALANGCPVVTYDFKYGPRDSIENGVNGYLVEKGNIEALAARMEELLGDEESLKKMSQNARKMIEKYRESLYMERWREVLYSVMERADYKNQITSVKFLAETYRFCADKTELEMSGEIRVNGTVPACAMGREHIYLRLYEGAGPDYQIIEAETKKEQADGQVFQIQAKIPRKGGRLSVCVEWDHSFVEAFMELKL